MLGFVNRLARRMPQHNGYRTLGAGATLAQLHPATARIAADEAGLLPRRARACPCVWVGLLRRQADMYLEACGCMSQKACDRSGPGCGAAA